MTLKNLKNGTFLNVENIKKRLILEDINIELAPNYTSISLSGEIEREVLDAFEVVLGSVYDGQWDRKDFANFVKRFELGADIEGLGISGDTYNSEKASLGDMTREFIELTELGLKKEFSCYRDPEYVKKIINSDKSKSENLDQEQILKLALEYSGIEPIRGPQKIMNTSYEDIRTWWEHNYHGNTGVKIFTYGNINVKQVNDIVAKYIPCLKPSASA